MVYHQPTNTVAGLASIFLLIALPTDKNLDTATQGLLTSRLTKRK